MRKKIEKEIYLWFGEDKQNDTMNLTDNERRIVEYNKKKHGNNFYVPKGIKAYFKELGLGKKWKET
jgi:hypothetical protein